MIDRIGIIGGGPVGLCAALALQHDAQNVTVIEATNLEQSGEGGLNSRSIALSYSSVQIFQALGIWPAIKSRAAAIDHIHISSRGRWGVTRLHAGDYDLPALGYVIEIQPLVAELLRAVEASKKINLICEASFQSIGNHKRVDIRYTDNDQNATISCDLALIADGAGSQAREALGIDHRIIDYGQSAIITNVEFSRPLTGYAFERFTDQGPLALLPLAGKRFACVWTGNTAPVERLKKADDSDFIDALQQCFGFRLGHIEKVGKRFAFPLQRTQADSLGVNRCLLVGNAANTLHPVAGQGFNLALRDIAGLHELLQKPVEISDLAQDYENLRLAEQRRVVAYGDGLVGLFSNRLPLLDHARAGGLALLDLLPPLKARVAMTGMGFGFGGNALLRGRL